MKKFFTNKFWLGVVSLFLAILLFLTATATSMNHQDNSKIAGASETYTHTLTDVPIDIKYDSDDYFISGYSYGADVYMSSVNRVKLDSEINEDTRKFKVVADLTNMKPGTHKVPLKVVNLPSGVNATVSPTTITVTMGKKKTKEFPVYGHVNDKQIKAGYAVDKMSVDVSKVKVTSNESIIDRIDHVAANIPDDKVLDDDFNKTVTLQAVTADGTVLASIIHPSKATLSVKVKKLTKTVPINLIPVGQFSDSISKINYKLSQEKAVISGTKEALEAISVINAEVDISDVTKNTEKKINLSANNVSVDPAQVTVQLTTTKK
ncbi:TPA: YbbR-like domain-containing protein [Streptococcus agalactiae]|nr:YbbR-like domain-containing protein [Streptococcus agalactiae]